ncbi:phosphate-selective porin O/P [Alkalispirillum mobile]|uniref:Phosphate-selective porin O/P n=1 Tax=Alkalispirillum mobile TaxID=85925 RepID=A0A498C9S6_9GAMM|nr:porin [Alkalispirillum mobile]RLK51106.1 phosphate-selective porin O/P [Alkalispirillum mobile]
MTAAISSDSLRKSFDGRAVLRDISFELPAGQCLVLLGPSGCGKSTLLNIVTGMLQADGGELWCDGQLLDSSARAVHRPMKKRGFAMVFQDFSLWPHMTVADNVAFGLRVQGVRGAERRKRVADALEQVQMDELADRKPNTLSGGQAQRVAIARAIAVRPRLLLLDEPLSALDAKLRDELKVEISALIRKTGVTALYVTHDQAEAFTLAARASFAPVLDSQRGVWSHLGASFNYRENAYEYEKSRGREREYEDVRMRTRLGTRAVDGRMIGENDMEAVSDWTTYALEGAFGVGPFSLQGEYIRQELNRDEDSRGFDDPDVTKMEHDGFYIQASYFLTGEQRNYRAFSGDFGATEILRPLSAGGRGGVELLARFARADSYEHHEPDDRQKLDHWTIGLNWYPENDIVLKLNAMYVDAERGERGIGEGRKTWDSMVYAARFQYEF